MADSLAVPFTLYTIGIWVCLSIGYKPMIGFLERLGMVRANYKGDSIPLGVGIAIPVIQVISMPWSVFEGVERVYLVQTCFLVLIAFVGWMDDRFGGTEAKGIKGHVSLWWKEGIWSTGMGKAATGIWVAIIVSTIYSKSVWEWILHAGLIVLLINQINLFDLRPGRAIKGFGVYLLILLVQAYASIPLILCLPVVVTVLFLFREDIRGKAMLGDTGSNVLGFAMAFWLVIYASLFLKILIFSAGVLIQIYAEKKSISSLIQRTPVLYWLDMLGRRETRKP